VSSNLLVSPPERESLRQNSGVSLTATSWLPETDLGIRDWADQGRRLGVVGRAAGWWIGDWLRYGNARFGERYARAARITGYDVQTLMNMVYVASHIPPEERREGLSWSHHAEVAPMEREERERWLDFAETERLSVRCLRDEIRRARPRDELAKRRAAKAELVCPDCGCRFTAAKHAELAAGAAAALPEARGQR
jgi:hypothetical protein